MTGEKSRRPLQETFASVAVLTASDIARQNLTNLYELLDTIPNVAIDGNQTTFSIRGVDAFNVSGSGEGPLASVYLDGAAIPRLALASGPLDVFDVAQVEVFRGPQSTIQGRNTLAGAVIINTADPTFGWTGKARLILRKESGETRAGLALGGPIIDDEIAFRVTGEASKTDGFMQNVTLGRHADRTASLALRGKILIQPAIAPRLSVLAGILHDRHERGAFYGELDSPFAAVDRVVTSDVQDVRSVDSRIGSVTARYEIGAQSTLISLSNFSRFRFRSLADADRTATPDQLSRIDEPTRTFQQEVRFHFREPWMEGIIGAVYLRERRAYQFSATQSLSLSSLGVPAQLQSIGLPQTAIDEVIALYGGTLPIQNSLSQPQLTQNHAAFTDLTVPLAGRTRLRLGLRYDREGQKRSATQTVVINRALPDPRSLAAPTLGPIVSRLNASLQALAQGGNSGGESTQVVYDAWLPMVGVTHDLSKDVAVAGTVRRGYRAGGAGINQQRGESFSFRPEFTTNFELAVRSAWLDRHLTINANLFWTEWKNQQIAVQLTPGSLYDTQIVNAARSRLYGFEMESRARITDALDIYAGIGFTRANFKEFDLHRRAAAVSYQGKEFPRAPRWSISGGASFAHPRGPFANLGASYRSAYYQTVANQEARDIPGRATVNARIGWKGRFLSASLSASNIFDVQKSEQFFIDTDGRRRGALSEPRVLGLVLEGQI